MAKRKPERKLVRRKTVKPKTNSIWEDDSKSPVPPPLKKQPRPQKEGRRLNYQDNKAYNRIVRQDDLLEGFVGSANPGTVRAWRLKYWKENRPITTKKYRVSNRRKTWEA